MKNLLRKCVLAAAFSLLLSATALAADVGDLGYTTKSDGTIAITYCRDVAYGALEIPAVIDGRPVTSITNSAFSGCKYLTSVTIPDGVTSIGHYAFYNCNSLTNVTIPSSVTSIGSSAFHFCSSLMRITIPEGVTIIEDRTFYDCSSLTDVTIPSSVTSIEHDAFRECSGLSNVTIPASVISIGESAFQGCRKLTHVMIPDNATVPASEICIGGYAFAYCTSLTSVTISNGVTNIGTDSFRGCNSLTSVTILKDVTSIGVRAFYNCSSLTNVAIPTSVTSIGYGAFLDCDSLTDVYYEGDTKAWEKVTIGDFNDALIDATIHYCSKGPGKDAVNIQVPFGKYQFHVVDGDGKALPGALVTYDSQSGFTDKDGMVPFDQYTIGTPLVTAKLDGYTTWSNANSNWSKSDSRYETITLYPVGLGEYKLSECRYSNASDMSHSTNLLTRTKTLNLKNTGNMIGDLDSGDFYLTCRAAKTDGIALYELRQGSSVIARSLDGDFGKLSVTWFSKGGGVTVRVVTTDGKTVDTAVNLQFTENKVNNDNSIEIMDKISFKVRDDVPFLGGSTVNLDFDALPVDIKANDTGVYIGFNKKSDKDKDPIEKLKKTMDAAKKVGALPLDKNTKDALKSMMKEDKDLALPGAKFKVTAIGYAEADWGDSEAKGELYVLLEGQTKTFGFNTVVVAVPVTVQVKAFAKLQTGGEIIYNWSTNQIDGGVNLDVTVGLDAFGGIGVGKVMGVGAYGQADVDVEARVMGTRRGFEKVDLTGELGLKAYIAWFTWERAFAHNTWHLYTQNNVRSMSLDEGAALFSLYDASQYQVEPLDYLRDESGWLGDSIGLMAADANTTLTPLLEGTYRNAQPVMVQAGEYLYAAFLRGDAETGHVSVWVTRFDGESWAAPVQADRDAILDDAPTLCVDGAGNVWLAYARTTVEPGASLRTYAQNQRIVVGKIDPETLEFTEKGAFAGQDYTHLQQLTVVGGQPVLVWADSAVTVDNSVLFPKRSCVHTSTYNGSAWGEATLATQVDKPIWQLTAGEVDGALTLAYIQDEDGDPSTETDHDLYQLAGGNTEMLARNVQGNIAFGTLPGQSAAGFLWSAEDALCAEGISVPVPGVTGEYAVVGDSIYYSTASGGSADLAVLQYHDGRWGEPIQLTDGNRYLENLSVARLNDRDYVLGMHTQAGIGTETVDIDKNLVWAVVQPVSDLRLESVSYDVEAAAAGAEVPVTLSVCNAGDHEVSGVDIQCDGTTIQSVACELLPGESTEFTVSLTCPEVCTEYTFTVAETDEDDFTPDDNSRTVEIGYADVSVELSYEQVGTSQTLIATLTNQGVETASGTLLFTDADGNNIGFTTFEGLASGDAALTILPLAEDFSGGTVSVLAELDQEELYTYNNTARQSVVHMAEPELTVIRSVQISGTRVTAQLVSAEEASCTAYCAVYDTEGRLLEVTSSAISPGEHTVDFTASVTFATARVFLLNEDCAPVCESRAIPAGSVS